MTGIRGQGSGISRWRHFGALALLGFLSACAGKPPPPDWKMNAQSALESYEKQYLDGNSRLAALNYERARAELARTGRPDLQSRAELIRCATEMAALVSEHCAVLGVPPADSWPAEHAYGAFLRGEWDKLSPADLPETYRPLLKAGSDTALESALAEIKDPLSRLIAAGVLFQQGRITPAGIATATLTASDQGWRRPLLAWLHVQRQRAEAAGDREAAASLQRRIDLVHGSLPDGRGQQGAILR